MNNPLNNLGDASPAMAELRTLLGGLKDHATLNLELCEAKRLIAELKEEAAAQLLRADQAEAEAAALTKELESEKSITKRFSFMDFLQWDVIHAVIDMHPEDLRAAFLRAQAGPFPSANADVKRLADACVALAAERLAQYPDEEVA